MKKTPHTKLGLSTLISIMMGYLVQEENFAASEIWLNRDGGPKCSSQAVTVQPSAGLQVLQANGFAALQLHLWKFVAAVTQQGI